MTEKEMRFREHYGIDDERSGCASAFCAILVVIALLLCMTILSACKTIQVVPEIHKEYIHDTLSLVDSVYRSHYIIIKGDTIWQKDTIYEYRWRDKVVEVLKTDSVPYPVEVEKQVRYIPGFYKWSTWALWMIIAALLLYAAWRVVKAIYLRR